MSFPSFDFENDRVNDFFSNVTSFLLTKAEEKFIKVSEPPKGNLTADQVAQGQKGQIQGLPAPQVNNNSKMIGIVMIVVAVFAAIFLLGKKR